MIRAVAQIEGGMAIMLGVTEGNVERLKDGMPIDVDLGALLIQTYQQMPDSPEPGRLRLFISYKPTHEAVVREWIQAGLPIDPGLIESAREIDATP